LNTGGNVIYSAATSTTTSPGVFLDGGATLQIGTAAASVLNVTGNLTFRSGTGYSPDIGDDGKGGLISDLLNVTGTVAIDPTSILSVEGLALYSSTVNDAFTVLSANTITGSFASPITVGLGINKPINPTYPAANSLLLTLFPVTATFQLTSAETDGTYLWSNAANWGGQLPINGTQVDIPLFGSSPIIVFDASAGTIAPLDITAREEFRLTGGSLIFDDDATFNADVDFRGGTFGGDALVKLNGGQFTWTGGTLAGTGSLDLTTAGIISITGSGNPVVNGISMQFANTHDINLTTGSLTIQSGSMRGVGGLNTINSLTIANGASFNITGGSAAISDITVDGDLTQSGGSISLPGGTLDVNGNLNWNGGSISIGTGFNVNSGGQVLVSGTPTASNGTITLLNGGLLGGTGTLTANINNTSGNLSAGNSPGTLTIQGDLTLAAGSTTTMEVTGLTQGSTTVPGGYDFINVIDNPGTTGATEGNVTVNGTLNIITSSYTGQAIGDSFDFIQAQTSMAGAFSAVSTTTGYEYNPSIITNTFNLATTAIPIPAPPPPPPTPPPVVDPVVEDPVVEDPVVEDPVVEDPVVEDPIVEDPVVEDPVVEDPVVEDPVVEDPVINTPTIDTDSVVPTDNVVTLFEQAMLHGLLEEYTAINPLIDTNSGDTASTDVATASTTDTQDTISRTIEICY